LTRRTASGILLAMSSFLAWALAAALLIVPTASASQPLPTLSAPRVGEDDGSLYDGYWWGHDGWVPGLISVSTYFRRAPRYSYGASVFYAPGVMEATAAYRGLSLDGYIDGVAMMSPADIGRTVWLRRPGLGWEGPFLVVDCAQRDDMWPIVRFRGEVVEVGFETALRWGMTRRTGSGGWRTNQWRTEDVEVWVGDSAPSFVDGGRYSPMAVNYAEWFFEHSQFTTAWLDVAEPVAKENACWYYRDEKPPVCPEDFPAEPLIYPERDIGLLDHVKEEWNR